MTDLAKTFADLPLSAEVRRALDELGYVTPTPVQLAVFEAAARGASLVVQARTGTGKTAAFGLPLVDAIVRHNEPAVQALVLCPTRELALQVGRELQSLSRYRAVAVTAIYGGAPMEPQIAALRNGAQIVCGTPGRVLDHLRRGTLNPDSIRAFVLDEADEMLSMGFARELSEIVRFLPKERQGLFFSATIPPDIERLAHSQLKSPEFITLSSDAVGASEIAHYTYPVVGDKREALLRIIEIENPESAIVFCNTKDETERVAAVLRGKGYDAEWLNGDLDQKERERVMQKTREGRVRFLVCTDVASRGIDISHLTHVINADFPESAENYVHRTGRTGRAGRTGTAISLIGPKDVGNVYLLRLTYKLRPIEKSLPSAVEIATRAESDLCDLLAQTFAKDAFAPRDRAVAARLMARDDLEDILAGVVSTYFGGESAWLEAETRRRAMPPRQIVVAAETPPTRSESRERTPRESRPRETPRDDAGARPRAVDSASAARAPDRRDARPARGASPSESRTRTPRERVRHDAEAPAFIGFQVEGEEPVRQFAAQPSASSQTGDGTHEPEPATRRMRSRVRAPRDSTAMAAGIEGARSEGGQSGSARAASPNAGTSSDGAGNGTAAPPTGPTGTVIFVNMGRRDGVDEETLQSWLAAAGIPSARALRVRDRMSFVEVAPDASDSCLEALSGNTVGERTSRAEVARERAN